MTPQAVDHYGRLGLARDASARQVARAFHRAARTLHPDAGGDAAEFAAVAEAYRILSDARARAAYDRELDGLAADWSDVGWGTDVGGPETSGDDGWTGSAAATCPGEGSADDEVVDPWSLDPFVGGPRRIPDPLAPRVLPDIPTLPPGWRETTAAMATWALTLAMALMRALGSPPEGSAEALGDGAPYDAYGAIVMWIVFGCSALLLRATHPPRSGGRQVGVLVAALALFWWILTMGDPPWHPLFIATIPTALCAVGTGHLWARALWTRHSDPRRTAALRERDRPTLLDRHHRAVAWNRVRAELVQPGRTALVVGPQAKLVTGEPVPGRRWAFDPRTGTESVLWLPHDIPSGSWVVVDDEERVVVTAPPFAPDAWLDALRAGWTR